MLTPLFICQLSRATFKLVVRHLRNDGTLQRFRYENVFIHYNAVHSLVTAADLTAQASRTGLHLNIKAGGETPLKRWHNTAVSCGDLSH